MTRQQIIDDIAQGEGLHREFKEAHGQLPRNLFETVCAFLNTDGGTIFLGVADDGTITGIDPEAVDQMKIDLANLSNNPQKADPPWLLFPHEVELDGKIIITAQVPLSSQLHKTGGHIFLRSEDGDYRVKGTHQLAGLLNRKLGLFTEQRTIPFATLDDLRPELFDRARRLMRSYNSKHPWADLSNEEMLHIGGFYTQDPDTGKNALTLAALLMFGNDLAIQQAVPAYKFDCLLRRDNVERYDDRVMIYTNLIDAYDQMMTFIEKHLNDPFYQDEKANRVSLRDKIFREAISNIISHREYTGGAPARLMIYRDKVILDNPCTQHHFGKITPQNLRPFSKNPTICKFMIQLGRFDQLGSGVTNINKYLPLYARGATPIFNETRHGFELTIPLEAQSAAPASTGATGFKTGLRRDHTAPVTAPVAPPVSEHVSKLLKLLKQTGALSNAEILHAFELKNRRRMRETYIQPAMTENCIEYTIPDKPNSRLQKYRITPKGLLLIQHDGEPIPTQDRTSAGQVEAQEKAPVMAPVTTPVATPVTAPVSEHVLKLLKLLKQTGALSNAEILHAFELKSRRRLRENYIQPAMAEECIEYSIPDKPRSSKQTYRLTPKGRQILAEHSL